jgi:hypothetical protein
MNLNESQTRLSIAWTHGQGNSHSFVSPYSNIHDMPEKPGLYIWLLRPHNKNEFDAAIKIFEHATLEAKIWGNIRLSYNGTLEKNTKNIESTENKIFEGLISDVFVAAGYPLYIGISGNLLSRLTKHKKQFEESVGNRLESTRRAEHIGKVLDNLDTDMESQYFGARLGGVWPNMTTDRLYVKYVIPQICMDCIQVSCSKVCHANVMPELRKAEFASNTLFNPVFGRR